MYTFFIVSQPHMCQSTPHYLKCILEMFDQAIVAAGYYAVCITNHLMRRWFLQSHRFFVVPLFRFIYRPIMESSSFVHAGIGHKHWDSTWPNWCNEQRFFEHSKTQIWQYLWSSMFLFHATFGPTWRRKKIILQLVQFVSMKWTIRLTHLSPPHDSWLGVKFIKCE